MLATLKTIHKRLSTLFVVVGVFVCIRAAAQPGTVSVVYTGNMGTLIKSDRYQLLIDGLHLKYEDDYLNTPATLLDSIIYHKGNYKIDVLLVTHVHADHFNSEATIRFLHNNKKAKLIAPAQVADTLKTHKEFKTIAQQVMVAETIPLFSAGTGADKLIITPIPMLHTWQQKHKNISNMGYRIEINSKKLIHVGDAECNTEVVQLPCFKEQQYDVAIVPTWFLGKNNSALVAKYIRAKQFIVTHISPLEKDGDKYELHGRNHQIRAVSFASIYQTMNF